MSKIALVTDSTAYIPQEIVNRNSITVLPQVLIWGERSYQDGVDIQPDELRFANCEDHANHVPGLDSINENRLRRFNWEGFPCSRHFHFIQVFRDHTICGPGYRHDGQCRKRSDYFG